MSAVEIVHLLVGELADSLKGDRWSGASFSFAASFKLHVYLRTDCGFHVTC